MKYFYLPIILLSLIVISCAFLEAKAQPPPPPPPPRKDYFPRSWSVYTSELGRFKIRFPDKPTEFTRGLETPTGKATAYGLEYKGLLTYRIAYIDNPGVDEKAPKKILLGFKDTSLTALAAVKDMNPRILAEKEVMVDKYPGYFLHLEVKGNFIIRFQWVMVGKRLYAMSVDGRKGHPNELEGEGDFEKVAMGFINSFEILKESK